MFNELLFLSHSFFVLFALQPFQRFVQIIEYFNSNILFGVLFNKRMQIHLDYNFIGHH